MKFAALFLFFIFFSFHSSFSQDTLIMRDKKMILAKVLEISGSEVKYKRFDIPDGPLWVMAKTHIGRVNYSNGFKEAFRLTEQVEPGAGIASIWKPANFKIKQKEDDYFYMEKAISRRELNSLLLSSNNVEVIRLTLKSKRAGRLQYLGFVAIPTGTIAVGCLLAGALSNENNYILAAALLGSVSIPFVITGGVNSHITKEYKRQAVYFYNQQH